jgi:lipopolysaccharide/colanic/teichoic acid biosynthesis glycosyltransferase
MKSIPKRVFETNQWRNWEDANSSLALTLESTLAAWNDTLPAARLDSSSVIKRAVDILGALLGLLLTAPLVCIFGWLVRRESPGPILFKQQRLGLDGSIFTMLKLRTMVAGAEVDDHKHPSTTGSDRRLLRIGKLMRRWNIDEVPQFWNVLRGEMSLVGPRPERPFHAAELAKQIPDFERRLTVKPGMTGWAQINGLRGNTSMRDRLHADLFYVQNRSPWLDLKIMALTLRRRDADFC